MPQVLEPQPVDHAVVIDYESIARMAFAMSAQVWQTNTLPDAKDVKLEKLSLGNCFKCEITLDGIKVVGVVRGLDGRQAKVCITQVGVEGGSTNCPNSRSEYADVRKFYELMRRRF
jgi:hypothetical protein